jgi:hypothetical protein
MLMPTGGNLPAVDRGNICNLLVIHPCNVNRYNPVPRFDLDLSDITQLRSDVFGDNNSMFVFILFPRW